MGNRGGHSLNCVAQVSVQNVEQHPDAAQISVQNVEQHPDAPQTEPQTVQWSTTNVVRNFSASKEILLQCALGTVSHPSDKELVGDIINRVCMLFDGCSQRTYITAKLSLRLGLPFLRKEQLILKTFTDKEGKLRTMDVVQLCVWGDNVKVYIEALVVPFICSKLQIPPLDGVQQRYDYLQGLDLAEPPTPDHDVDLLVGLDHYFSLVTGQIRKGPPGHPTAIDSILGWMICGPAEIGNSGPRETMIHLISIEDDEEEEEVGSQGLKAELQRFWEVEAVNDSEDIRIIQEFQETVRFNGSRYVAELPLKDPSEFIPDHFRISVNFRV